MNKPLKADAIICHGKRKDRAILGRDLDTEVPLACSTPDPDL